MRDLREAKPLPQALQVPAGHCRLTCVATGCHFDSLTWKWNEVEKDEHEPLGYALDD